MARITISDITTINSIMVKPRASWRVGKFQPLASDTHCAGAQTRPQTAAQFTNLPSHQFTNLPIPVFGAVERGAFDVV